MFRSSRACWILLALVGLAILIPIAYFGCDAVDATATVILES